VVLNVPAPIVVPRSLKVTEPVGAAPPLPTVAVNVTVAPAPAGFTFEVTTVVVALYAAAALQFVASSYALTEPRPSARL
jgi:hypothetical protein